MTLLFQSILIVASILLSILMIRRIAQTRAKIEDSIFWLAFCFLIIVLGLFPDIATYFASLIGIISSQNFIFLFFIFALVMKLFFTSMRVSKLEMQAQELSRSIALAEARGGEERQGTEQVAGYGSGIPGGENKKAAEQAISDESQKGNERVPDNEHTKVSARVADNKCKKATHNIATHEETAH